MSRLVLNGLDLNGKNVSNMADGVSASDAVTLQQVQAYVRGLDWKDSACPWTASRLSRATEFC
jgi:hypothetical protein